jgi:hypothetical protein
MCHGKRQRRWEATTIYTPREEKGIEKEHLEEPIGEFNS